MDFLFLKNKFPWGRHLALRLSFFFPVATETPYSSMSPPLTFVMFPLPPPPFFLGIFQVRWKELRRELKEKEEGEERGI